MRSAGLIAAIALLSLLACVDLGYRVDPYTGEPVPVGGTNGATGDCVEGPTDPTTDGPQVRMITLDVDRRILEIAVGDVVTWTNTDTMRHTVTAGAPGALLPAARGGFDSGEFGTGGKWAYRFCNPRTVTYFCMTHPDQMNGYKVIVTP